MTNWKEMIEEKERQKHDSEKIKLYFLMVEVAVATFLIGYVLGLGEII